MIDDTRRAGGGDVPLKIGNTIVDVVDWLSAENARRTGVIIEFGELADARSLAAMTRTP